MTENFESPDTIEGHKKVPKQYTKFDLYIVGENIPRKNQLLFVDDVADDKLFVRAIDCFISFGTQENFIKNWETE